MSLIIKQEHSMINVEREAICERLDEINAMVNPPKKVVTERNKITSRLHAINRRLDEIEAQMQAEADAAAAKIAAEVAAAEERERERRARLPPDTMICCEDCQNDFVFSGEDQDRFSRHGWSFPFRCPDCRQARKDARERGEPMENPHSVKVAAISICCKDCHGNFDFSAQDQRRFAKKGYEPPIRCEACRDKKKNATGPKPVLINCKECHKDFTHSVGAQKHYAEMKWNDPVTCSDCRKLKHAKNTTRSSKTSA